MLPAGSLERPTISVFKQERVEAIAACIDQIAVFEITTHADRLSPVWRVQSRDGECVILRHIAYGQTPQGFIVDTAPVELRAGVAYSFMGHGWTRDWMPGVPWYGGGRAVFANDAWREIER